MSDRLLKESDVLKIAFQLPFVVNSAFADAVKALPSADRPQGKWKAKSFHEFFCNNCGFSFDMMKCEFLENMKFCPNCGADMREREGE